ncbi:MAG: hypothetical protein HQK55_04070 [Deltaproteobacteria bacterium]|nr:hypothetical protein [Deltaproteobacteria bacterium]
MKGLEALKLASFDWVMRLDDVWRTSPYDVPEFNAHLRQGVIDTCRQLKNTSPLGWVIIGPAGAGKTHLLASLRREAASAGYFFILVDMTDVKDFWETLLLGYLTSLREPEAQPQGRRLIVEILTFLGLDRNKAQRYAIALGKIPRDSLVENTNKVIQKLGQRFRQKVISHQDIIRALFLLNSDDFVLGNLGYTFLQGLALEEYEAKSLGLRQPQMEPIQVLRGLSWSLGLGGPTILALDQLDAIVNEQHLASGLDESGDRAKEQKMAKMIIEGLGRGLSALPDHTTRTLCLLSCLESTWDIMRRTALKSSTDRFQAPMALRPVTQPQMAADLVARRLARAFRSVGIYPPFPTWPFRPQAFEAVAGLTPREILKRCEAYRRKCLETGLAEELNSLADVDILVPNGHERDEFKQIDSVFETRRQEAAVEMLLADDQEDQLGDLLQTACRCLGREAPLPDEIDVILETQFGGGKNYTPLHVRLSLIYTQRGAEETHICLRVLQKTNPTAYLARLAAAMTASGIDRHLSFRRLFLLRSFPPPDSPRCKEATEAYEKAGGRFLEMTADDIRSLWALNALEQAPPAYFDEWLLARKPISKISFFPEACPEFFQNNINTEASSAEWPSTASNQSGEVGSNPMENLISLGRSVEGPDAPRTTNCPVTALIRHVAVVAAQEQGKAVVIRRLIEGTVSAGLRNLASDTSGDLARLGVPWPDAPRPWLGGESKRAKEYHRKMDLTLHTPGQEKGRPLSFPLTPSFKNILLSDSSNEGPIGLDDLLRLTMANFVELTSGGRWGKPAKKKTIFTAALKYFALQGGRTTDELIYLLENFPPEAAGRIKDAPQLALELAGILKEKMKKDLLLDPVEQPFDPELFFGPASRPGRVKVAVINLLGLSGLNAGGDLITRLIMLLAAWMKEQTPLILPELKGLLVIEEVKNFLPLAKTSPCKEALVWLASHGLKYGLGLVMATNYPKEVDLEVMSGFSTWLIGGDGTMPRLKPLKKIVEHHGGKIKDLTSLNPNYFLLVAKEWLGPPTKISVPMSWSHYSPEQLPMDELLDRARKGGK